MNFEGVEKFRQAECFYNKKLKNLNSGCAYLRLSNFKWTI
ncbi:hypothetical protein AsAng_0054800 [Aureispira anguillae]|uniref:Uncharacterized protein n=1 Tax=Aureispira anguillae TaxID=2864201 RepID=A0A915YK56_9BACT|nr:hypothetical protein AsAng_0054800 [Aureispira anguillae]